MTGHARRKSSPPHVHLAGRAGHGRDPDQDVFRAPIAGALTLHHGVLTLALWYERKSN
jgi:hypothetical protein